MGCSAGYVGALYAMSHVSLSPSPSPLPAIQARPRSVQTHKKLNSDLERSVHLTRHMASHGALIVALLTTMAVCVTSGAWCICVLTWSCSDMLCRALTCSDVSSCLFGLFCSVMNIEHIRLSRNLVYQPSADYVPVCQATTEGHLSTPYMP